MSVPTGTDLWRLSTSELAEAIKARQASSHEVIEAHLHRIDEVNPAVNAVTVVLGEQALDAAKAADREIVANHRLPPLHGVPFTIKPARSTARATSSRRSSRREDLCLDAAEVEDRIGIITPIDPHKSERNVAAAWRRKEVPP